MNPFENKTPPQEWLAFAEAIDLKYDDWDFDASDGVAWYNYINRDGKRALQVGITVSVYQFKEHVINGDGMPSFFASCECDETWERFKKYLTTTI